MSDEQRARELLAREYDTAGMPHKGDAIRAGNVTPGCKSIAVRAIIAAMQPAPGGKANFSPRDRVEFALRDAGFSEAEAANRTESALRPQPAAGDVERALEDERESHMRTIKERDHAYEIIDKLCDAVLGTDRREWSSLYDFEDAVEEVEDAIAALAQQAPKGGGGDVRAQANAWLAVCDLLDEISPEWADTDLIGREAALTAIRKLATPQPAALAGKNKQDGMT